MVDFMALIRRFVEAVEGIRTGFDRLVAVMERPEPPLPDESVVGWRDARRILGMEAQTRAGFNRQIGRGRVPAPNAPPGPKNANRWTAGFLRQFMRERDQASRKRGTHGED